MELAHCLYCLQCLTLFTLFVDPISEFWSDCLTVFHERRDKSQDSERDKRWGIGARRDRINLTDTKGLFINDVITWGGRRGESAKRWRVMTWWHRVKDMMTWWQEGGGGVVRVPPKNDDVIYEQPLIGAVCLSVRPSQKSLFPTKQSDPTQRFPYDNKWE